MQIEHIAPHLWWWTAPHPDWSPSDFKNGQGWERDVSSYALVGDGSLVLFDPLVPKGDEEEFWKALDGDVEHHGPPAILLTVFWHVRSSPEILERYDGATLWAHQPSADDVRKRVEVTNTFNDGDVLPAAVEGFAMHHMNEAAFWLPSQGALVFGDSYLGYEDGVQACPESWLRRGESKRKLHASLERVLNSTKPGLLLLTHGGPRRTGVREARALRPARRSP